MGQTVLITGATGLIGKVIVEQCLAKDFTVHFLTTVRSKIVSGSQLKGFYWDPQHHTIDPACFEGVDAIINLAGTTVAQRWTKSAKHHILNSRILTLRLLSDTIKNQNIQIKQIISASAIGIYPDSKVRYYEEDFQGTDATFLRKVVHEWEDELESFKALGIRTTILRIGIVLDSLEGALPKLIQPIKNFVGSSLGSGEQWQSWIHKDDLGRMFLFALEHELEGVYNAVAPNPVQQSELTRILSRILKRPLLLPKVPEFVLFLLLGEMSALVLESQRVCANKIQTAGFEFYYHELIPALENLL
jgi:uncharacterized protein (TIGR01777 family)